MTARRVIVSQKLRSVILAAVFLTNAGSCAVNAVLYAFGHEALNLVAAIASGLVAVAAGALLKDRA